MQKMNGNAHIPHPCPFCWRVLYSKGALTRHLNDEHWDDSDEEAEASDEE
jgi:hypothetical protein